MHKTKKYAIAITLSSILLPGLSLAETERHHEAHVHGLANLNIAIEGKKIHAALESPAANIIGFEHRPHNEQELHHAQEAMSLLEKGDTLFLFSPAAGCKLVGADVQTTMKLAIEHDDEKHDEEAHQHENHSNVEHHHKHHDEDEHHDQHDEGEHHDQHSEDEHHHEHHHGEVTHHHPGNHSDVDAEYQFLCENPKKLNTLQVNFFDHFQGFQKIKAQVLGRDKQTGAEFTPKHNSIKF